MQRYNISATIVTYNSYDKCRETLESIYKYTKGVELTVYIVDNNSTDRSPERLKEDFPSIVLIKNDDNKGFGHGHNCVLSILDSRFHFIVNPDIIIETDIFSELSEYLDKNPDVGLVTPKILNMDGTDQMLPKRDPSVLALLGRRIFKKALKNEVGYYQMLDKNLDEINDIEFATGCFFGIDTDLFKEINGFDERFFLYYEDMDITRRARAVRRAVYNPFFYVYHAWERSSAHSLRYFVVLVKGMFTYFKKWGFKFRYTNKEKKEI